MKAAQTVGIRPAAEPLAAMARFVVGYSHCLKSPLTGAKGYGQLVEREDDSERRRYWGRRLQGGLDSLDLMIEGFRRYQVPERIALQRVNVSLLVAEAWRMALEVTPGAGAKRLALDCRLGAGDQALVDPFHFRNLLVNLMQNAIDASPAGASVVITGPAGLILLAVADSGPGLGELSPSEIVRPFFTTHPDRAGLGLAVAQQIAADHGMALEWQALQPCGLAARIVQPANAFSQRSDR